MTKGKPFRRGKSKKVSKDKKIRLEVSLGNLAVMILVDSYEILDNGRLVAYDNGEKVFTANERAWFHIADLDNLQILKPPPETVKQEVPQTVPKTGVMPAVDI